MEPEPRLVQLAAAAADGATVGWEAGRSMPAAPAVRALEALAAAVRKRLPADAGPAREPLSVAIRLLCLLAGTRALLGVWFTASDAEHAVAAPLLAFALTAAVLLYAGDRDPRAVRLGAFYLVVAATLATRPIALAAEQAEAAWVRGLAALQPEAFLSAAFLTVVRRFPTAPDHLPAQLALARLQRLAAALGTMLFLATAVAPWTGGLVGQALVAMSRGGTDGRGRLYWAASFTLMTVGAAMALRKTRAASGDEGRRVVAFVVAVFAGLAPLVVLSLAAIALPAVDGWIDRHEDAANAIVWSGLISLPVTTAAAVAAGRVLSLRLLARRALSYAFARTTLRLLVLVPATLLLIHLYLDRDRPLAQSLGASSGLDLLRLMLAGAVLSLARGPLTRGLNRLFSRGDGDRGAALQRLLGELSAARGRGDVARALSAEVRRSLGAAQVRVFVRRSSGPFVAVDGASRPLGGNSALVALLDADARPLDLTASSLLGLLPEEDRAWACDQAVALVVPVPGSSGEPCGLLALGERVSEQPWDREAQELAVALAAAAGIALSRTAGPEAVEGAAAWDDEPGFECGACSRVRSQAEQACGCGARHGVQAALPAVVLGKFALARRLGAGGMGVVYEAQDLALGRTVALKTLPRLSSVLALRLRSEARVMASIDHPGVATLFGAETWKGVPFLVVEYLPGDTLADRLARGPLTVEAGLTAARSLARTLADLHDQGLLHRDVKPGNVGLRGDGSTKLLDFGLAQLIELGAEDRMLAGTPRYLPPEAWDGDAPSPAWDLWGLAVVVHEALAGRHPFQRASEEQTLDAIREGAAARVDPTRAPAWLADLIHGALARDPKQRPIKSARAFASALTRSSAFASPATGV